MKIISIRNLSILAIILFLISAALGGMLGYEKQKSRHWESQTKILEYQYQQTQTELSEAQRTAEWAQEQLAFMTSRLSQVIAQANQDASIANMLRALNGILVSGR